MLFVFFLASCNAWSDKINNALSSLSSYKTENERKTFPFGSREKRDEEFYDESFLNQNKAGSESFFRSLRKQSRSANLTCVSDDQAVKCEMALFRDFSDCVDECSTRTCVDACKSSYFENLKDCPCHENCAAGCDGCDHESCKNRCDDLSSYPAALSCFTEAKDRNDICQENCAYDIDCRRDCLDVFESALDICPCGPRCTDGCPCLDCLDCISCEEICEAHNTPQLDLCYEAGLVDLNTCSETCSGESCIQCQEDFDDFLNDCPCQSYCKDGCPCDHWDCNYRPTTTTTTTVSTQTTSSATTTNSNDISSGEFVLVLHGINDQFMFDRKTGEKWPLYSFDNPNRMNIQQGCSVVYKNDMLIFGGSSMKTSIVKVENCGIQKIQGNLPYNNMKYHDCKVYEPEDYVMLCFPSGSYKNCWRYNGEKTVTAESSVNSHQYGKLANIGEYLLAIGDVSQATVELFDGQAWRLVGPFIIETIYYDFDTLTIADKTYTIGGVARNHYSDSVYVGILETFPVTRVTWSLHEHKLQSARYNHRVIGWHNQAFIFGGYSKTAINGQYSLTEHWTFHNNGTITSEEYDHEVGNSYQNPELFFVNHDFCT